MSETPNTNETASVLAEEVLAEPVHANNAPFEPLKDVFFKNQLGVQYDEEKVKNILKIGFQEDESLKNLAKQNSAYLQDPIFLDNVIKKGIQALKKQQNQPQPTLSQQEMIMPTRPEKKFTPDKAKRMQTLMKEYNNIYKPITADKVEELDTLIQEMTEYNIKDNFKTFNNQMKVSFIKDVELAKRKGVFGASFFVKPRPTQNNL